jgi:hypothetical protein
MDSLMQHIQYNLAKVEGPFSWKLVDRVWTNTLPKCALQRCVLVYFRLHTPKKSFISKADQINSQFLLELCHQHFHRRNATPAQDAYR